MTDQKWFMDLAGEVVQAYSQHYMPAVQAKIESAGMEGWDLQLAQLAMVVEPEPLTADRVLQRVPYMSAQAAADQLSGAAERGALVRRDDEGYAPTDAGRALVEAVRDAVGDSARELADRVPPETERLANLLQQQSTACAGATRIDAPCIRASRALDPGPEAPVLERVRRYVFDLYAYRDDVHVAAWRAYEVPGYEWEVFSHVWGENIWGDPVASAADAAEKLGFRGYQESEYDVALRNLAARGWLAETEGRYQLTAEGRKIRQAAEVATDRAFFAPWQLTDLETGEMRRLMEGLRNALRPAEDA